MGGEELDAEFERLGEAEVVARVTNKTYDQYARAYALRWLSDRALARVTADEEAGRAGADREARARYRLRLMILAVIAICALLAALVMVNKAHAAGVDVPITAAAPTLAAHAAARPAAAARKHRAPAVAPAAPRPVWTVAAAGPDDPGAPRDGGVHALIGSQPLSASPHAAVIAVEAPSAPVIEVGSLDGPSLGAGGFILLVARAAADPSGAGFGGRDPLTCMTQAVYFEARSESLQGQEAVAQVVMNRTRLPQYPSQVCDVVFQGAERATGCQFSFVCDGALGPPAEGDAWRRAEIVAQRALAGYVYEPLRDATHFHATYVNPYWSGSLTRIMQIGGHIFYR